MGDQRRGHPVAGVLMVVLALVATLFTGIGGWLVAWPQSDPASPPSWAFGPWMLFTFLVLVGGLWVSWRVWSGGWGSRRQGSA